MVTIECGTCRTPVTLKPSRVNRLTGKNYCSLECHGASRSHALSDRIATQVDRTGGENACWEWSGYVGASGYGKTHRRQGGRFCTFAVHRLAYESEYGPIPVGMLVCHSCDNKRCCNPKHLFIGTSKDNNDDRDRKGRSGLTRNTKGQFTAKYQVSMAEITPSSVASRANESSS